MYFYSRGSLDIAHLLLIKMGHKDWNFEWLYSCAVDEGQEAHWIAVQAVEMLLETGYCFLLAQRKA